MAAQGQLAVHVDVGPSTATTVQSAGTRDGGKPPGRPSGLVRAEIALPQIGRY